MSEFELKTSETKRQFATGATRNASEGKGRFDLISPIAMRRLAKVMEKGAAHHKPRNWELGIPMSCYIDSAKRHIDQYLEGLRDEDHLAQGLFNIMACIHTEEMIERGLLPKELNDLPNYLPKKE